MTPFSSFRYFANRKGMAAADRSERSYVQVTPQQLGQIGRELALGQGIPAAG
jgi:hypothetical protein